VSVLASAPVDLHRTGASGPQHGHELIQEQRNPMVDFRVTGRWHRPRRDLRSTPSDDLFAVERDELVEHRSASRQTSTKDIWGS
jgi:hypothetical protein